MMGTPAADVKIKAWTPAILCKIQDNIVSSQFANAKVFMPSYESTRVRPSMGQLLTNEYQRIWWEEKEAWDKKFSRKTVSKSLLQRKVIPRKPPTKGTSLQPPKKGGKSKKKIESPDKQKDSKKSVPQKRSTGLIEGNKSEQLSKQKKPAEDKAMAATPNISLSKDLETKDKKKGAESPLEEETPNMVSQVQIEQTELLENAEGSRGCGCIDHA